MRPLVGITAGEIYNKEHPWSPYVYGQSYTYSDAIIEVGGTPVILPITHNQEVIAKLIDSVDGVLFAGGNDITPSLYGQELTYTKDNSEARDVFEIALMKRILEIQKPILAICRGMQLLNVVRGGTLYQDIEAELSNKQNHSSSNEAKSIEHLAHQLSLLPGCKLTEILKTTTINANSHHHQAINHVGDRLVVNAYAEDGVIEGLEDMTDGYVIGVQSHPESLFQRVAPEWENLFVSFVDACKNNKPGSL